MIRVLLVDDDADIRSSLRLILDTVPDVVVVGDVDSGERGLAVSAQLGVDVVVVDLRMPGMDGIEVTKRLRERANPPAVLILTAFSADDTVLTALAAGAAGFLLKNFRPDKLPAAVRDIAHGRGALAPSVAATVIRHAVRPDHSTSAHSARGDDDLGDLTERERELAYAVGLGMSNTGIATHLGISPASAKTYVSRLLEKLGLQNRTQLAIAAHRAGILS
ncbi:response regulator transcription factor [Frondihabitans sp. VKM Ac-2883]|uniref:response regulator n=1 Tax=Frondihabitans sp. VKM Ac-2883 TaxID=2783823 RepID=UPI00188B4C92|nr:response regulator transcription factor [Frondihabitans sp. VKM Ac-2883]